MNREMGVAPAVTRVKGTGGRSCRILFSRLLLRVCLVAEARLSYQVADNPNPDSNESQKIGVPLPPVVPTITQCQRRKYYPNLIECTI